MLLKTNVNFLLDDDYLVSEILELNFEFRTTEQNGIILSISDPRNSPAFSIELQNGALVMAVDTGSGTRRHASNNLDSDFALCNNQWHSVTTLYSASELTVIVNGIRKTWVQPDSNSMFDEYEAALYIGGLPGMFVLPDDKVSYKRSFSHISKENCNKTT